MFYHEQKTWKDVYHDCFPCLYPLPSLFYPQLTYTDQSSSQYFWQNALIQAKKGQKHDWQQKWLSGGQVEFQHVKLIQIELHDIVYTSHSHIQHHFCLQRFLSESRDLRCNVKPKRYSFSDISFRILDYVITSHQALLSKTTKDWDGFVSHCKQNKIRKKVTIISSTHQKHDSTTTFSAIAISFLPSSSSTSSKSSSSLYLSKQDSLPGPTP